MHQNLIIENKTAKYFKYAIVEIVLVIIGILITLHVGLFKRKLKGPKQLLAMMKKNKS